MNYLHYPVMNSEVVEIFRGSGGKLFIDCTVGLGGHSRCILSQIPGSRVLALDIDQQSLRQAETNLKEFGRRVTYRHCNFIHLFEPLDSAWHETAGILVDPGLSMGQLKDARRGFAHSLDGPLDMRKDPTDPLSADQVLNTFTENQLAVIFTGYGEVDKSRQLAKKIIEHRLFTPLHSTTQLRRLVEQVYRWRPRPGVLHPAAKVFQALRIFVNHELEGVAEFILKAPRFLKKGARMVFLTYHSLEDRIVKRAFSSLSADGLMELLRPFPRFPTAAEVALNPASRSAKMRSAQVVGR